MRMSGLIVEFKQWKWENAAFPFVYSTWELSTAWRNNPTISGDNFFIHFLQQIANKNDKKIVSSAIRELGLLAIEFTRNWQEILHCLMQFFMQLKGSFWGVCAVNKLIVTIYQCPCWYEQCYNIEIKTYSSYFLLILFL